MSAARYLAATSALLLFIPAVRTSAQRVNAIHAVSHLSASHIAFSPNEELLATGGSRQIRIWRLSDFAQVASVDATEVRGLVFDPTSAKLLYAEQNGNISIWDVENNCLVSRIGEPWFRSLVGSPRRIAEFSPQYRYQLLKRMPVTALAISPDGSLVAAGIGNGVHVWDIRTSRHVRTFGKPPQKATVPLSELKPPNEMQNWTRAVLDYFSLSSCTRFREDEPNEFVVWDAGLGSEGVLEVAFTPDSKRIVASRAHRTDVWDMESGNVHLSLEGCTHFAISPDGKRIAGGSRFCRCQIWDLASGKIDTEFAFRCFGLAFASDGKGLFVADSGALKRIDIASKTAAPINAESEHIGSFREFAISRSNKRLAASWERWRIKEVKVWSIVNEEAR